MVLWKTKTLKLLFIIATIAVLSSSCHVNRLSKAQRKAWNLEKEAHKRFSKDYEKAKKEHRKIQSRETLKRMKQLEKKSRELNKPRR
jgi:predicted phage gp36 major capsid-like protein